MLSPGTAPASRRDEAGATLIMSVLIMMILTSLSIAVLARTLSVLKSVTDGQQFDAALAAADAGLSDALFKIDQSAPPDWTEPTACLSSTVPCPRGAGTYSYTADKIDDTQYIVRSRGTVHGSSHAIAAKVTRTAKFPYALFSGQNLTLDGRVPATANFYSFNVFGGITSAPVHVGSNGTMVCKGGSFPTGLVTHNVSGNTENCPNYSPMTGPEPMPPVVAPTGATQDCPVNNLLTGTTFTGVVDGRSGRPFVCRQDVKFTGTVSVVNPPMILYILPDVDAFGNEILGSDGRPIYHSLDVRAALINPGLSATNVQIYKAGDKPVYLDAGNTSASITFSGVLYAPQTTLTINGGKWWTGSVVANEIVVNGTPNLTIGYDLGLSTYLGNDWKVSRYGEIPSSSAGLP